MKKVKYILIIVILSIFSLELLLKFFYPQDLQGTFFEQIENGLAVNKKFYKHKIHRYKNYTTSYRFGEFHNRITTQKNQDKNILILGDSWTLGYLLKDKNTFVHKLQKKFPNYYFVNSGTGGMGISRYTFFCEIFCKNIKPKYVIIFLNTGDVGRAWHSALHRLENNQLVKGSVKKYIKPKGKMDKIPFYSFLKHNSHLFIILRNTIYDIVYPPKVEETVKMKHASEDGCNYPQHTFNKKLHDKIVLKAKLLFKNLQENVKRAGSKLIVINMGWYDYKLMDENNPNKAFLKNAQAFFKKNNILYLDNTPHLENLHTKLCKYIIPIDSHPNIAGADEIFKASYLNLKKVLE